MNETPVTLIEGMSILARAALHVRWAKVSVQNLRKLSPEELGSRIEKLFEEPPSEAKKSE